MMLLFCVSHHVLAHTIKIAVGEKKGHCIRLAGGNKELLKQFVNVTPILTNETAVGI